MRAFAASRDGNALRDFFVLTFIRDLDTAIASATPSPKRPLAAGNEWISVGLDGAFAWRVPLLNEPPWDGHHYVLELTRDPLTREAAKGGCRGGPAAGVVAAGADAHRPERNSAPRRHGA